MVTYVYETIPKKSGDKIERFEWQQSILDDALEKHPETAFLPTNSIILGSHDEMWYIFF